MKGYTKQEIVNQILSLLDEFFTEPDSNTFSLFIWLKGESEIDMYAKYQIRQNKEIIDSNSLAEFSRKINQFMGCHDLSLLNKKITQRCGSKKLMKEEMAYFLVSLNGTVFLKEDWKDKAQHLFSEVSVKQFFIIREKRKLTKKMRLNESKHSREKSAVKINKI